MKLIVTVLMTVCNGKHYLNDAIKIIHEYLKTIDVIPFGRYGIWAYLWSDEAMLSGKKVAEKYSNKIISKS